MNPQKYHRDVQIICPTCGCTQFETETINSSEKFTCASCGRNMTRYELEQENLENINAHISEIKDEFIKDLQKDLKKHITNSINLKNF